MTNQKRHEFELYNLEIIVEKIDGDCTCKMKIGDSFQIRGGKLSLPENKEFCLYAIQSTLPLIPAKQRQNHPSDWMETEALITCPDPACKLIMRINRIGKQVFEHNNVSANKV